MNWAARRLSGRMHYAWISVGVVFFVLLAAAGTRATPSVMMLPLEQQFGWSRATRQLTPRNYMSPAMAPMRRCKSGITCHTAHGPIMLPSPRICATRPPISI